MNKASYYECQNCECLGYIPIQLQPETPGKVECENCGSCLWRPAKPKTSNFKELSRRDYFAAKAMEGLLASHTFGALKDGVSDACLIADALIAELDRTEKERQ